MPRGPSMTTAVTPASPGRRSSGSECGPSQADSSSTSHSISSARHVRGRCWRRSGEGGRVAPLDEERQPRPLQRILEAGHAPLDALAGRTRPRSFADAQAEAGCRGVDVVGTDRPADQVALARAEDPAAEVVASRHALVDDRDQLEVGVAERDDPVGRAPRGMPASGRRLEAERGWQSGRSVHAPTPRE